MCVGPHSKSFRATCGPQADGWTSLVGLPGLLPGLAPQLPPLHPHAPGCAQSGQHRSYLFSASCFCTGASGTPLLQEIGHHVLHGLFSRIPSGHQPGFLRSIAFFCNCIQGVQDSFQFPLCFCTGAHSLLVTVKVPSYFQSWMGTAATMLHPKTQEPIHRIPTLPALVSTRSGGLRRFLGRSIRGEVT